MLGTAATGLILKNGTWDQVWSVAVSGLMIALAMQPLVALNSGTEFAHPCRWRFILSVLSSGIYSRLETAFLIDFMQQCCFWERTLQAALPCSQVFL